MQKWATDLFANLGDNQMPYHSKESLEQRESKGEWFLKHFWSCYCLYEYSQPMLKMPCSPEFGFELKVMQEEKLFQMKRLADEFKPPLVV